MVAYSEVAVVMPAYNVERSISDVVMLTKSQIPGARIIVVDDCSNDRTGQIAEKAGALVLRHERNMGKGEGLNTGFSYLKKLKGINYVVLMDADMQHHPKDAQSILKPLLNDEADFVMGNRDWSKVPFRHRLGNFVWRTTFNMLFGTRLKDTNNGFMAMNKKAIKAVGRIYGGYIIDNQLLIRSIRAGLRITNAPVTVHYNHPSGVPRGIRMVLGVWLFILKEGLKYRFGR